MDVKETMRKAVHALLSNSSIKRSIYMSEIVRVKNTAGAFIIGFAAGDALGVPVEFTTRQQLQKEPIREMIGYGNH